MLTIQGQRVESKLTTTQEVGLVRLDVSCSMVTSSTSCWGLLADARMGVPWQWVLGTGQYGRQEQYDVDPAAFLAPCRPFQAFGCKTTLQVPRL